MRFDSGNENVSIQEKKCWNLYGVYRRVGLSVCKLEPHRTGSKNKIVTKLPLFIHICGVYHSQDCLLCSAVNTVPQITKAFNPEDNTQR